MNKHGGKMIDVKQRGGVDKNSQEIKGAGVLPYSIWKGVIYFLLGEERFQKNFVDSLKWSDFGGGCKSGETTIETAGREFSEETLGCIFTKQQIIEKIEKKQFDFFIDYNGYRLYVLGIDFRPYDTIFARHLSMANKYPKEFRKISPDCFDLNEHIKPDCFEKNQVKWFSSSQIYHLVRNDSWDSDCNTKPHLRDGFKAIMNELFTKYDIRKLIARGIITNDEFITPERTLPHTNQARSTSDRHLHRRVARPYMHNIRNQQSDIAEIKVD